jgi:DNA-binding GntR family transcriptional regulator
MDVRTLKEQVADVLRDALFSGRIKAGERLNESKLAKELGVSRLPIREALQQLQEQGLVVNLRRRGRFVINLSGEDIQKINSLRLVLESEALKLCRAKVSSEGLRTLGDLVQKMERSTAMPEIEAAGLDLEFHRTMWCNTGNDLLAKTCEGLIIPFFAHRVLWRIHQDKPGWAAVLADRHRILLDFIRGTTDKSAEAVVLDHLRYNYDEPEKFSSFALTSQISAAVSSAVGFPPPGTEHHDPNDRSGEQLRGQDV